MAVDKNERRPYKGLVRAVSMRFNEQLRTWREAAGLTQDDIAEGLGVKQQTVSDWERGRAMPSVGRAPRLAELLRVSAADLLREMASPDVALGEMDIELDGPAAAGPALLSGKLERLSERDRRIIERMVDEMLGQE